MYNFVFMEIINKKRGRLPIPKSEKKLPVTIWVKAKHLLNAKKECIKVQLKYESI